MALTPSVTLMTSLLMTLAVVRVQGHGTLVDPPSRGVMSRYGYNVPVNNDPYANYCGGIGVHYTINNGQCGVCGDSWSDSQPRDHENGGKYGLGIITRTYRQGETIPVSVFLSAAHKGGVSFSLCPISEGETQACFNRHPVAFEDNSYYREVTQEGSHYINVSLKLPADVTGKQVVLRWKYRGGNNWGCDTTCCLGCGRVQEEFYACSDIAIEATSGASGVQQNQQAVLGQFPVFPFLSNSVQTPSPTNSPQANADLCPIMCRIICITSVANCPSYCPVACRSL